MLVCLLFFYLVTLGLIHVSNMTQSVVMPKRFLYLSQKLRLASSERG
jgi:hypothetical protein